MFSVLRNTAIGVATLALAAGLAAPAQADYIVTLTEMADPSQPLGDDVVATGTGSIDLTDLTMPSGFSFEAAMNPTSASIIMGSTSVTAMTEYSVSNFPSDFGTGGFKKASSGSGNQAGVQGINVLVPTGYVSGTSLSDTDTYDNATFASLGLTPGTYVWTWGTGAHADSVTVDIMAAAAVPEPASLTLLAVGLAGLGMVRRYRRT